MTEVNHLANLSLENLRNHDFSQEQNLIKNDDLNRLLQQDGLISFDDSGRLVVVNSTAKRDNAFFRFIGGLFNSTYKEQQNIIGRAQILQNNSSFNRLLRNSVIEYNRSKMELSNAYNQDDLRLLTARVKKLFSSQSQVTTGMLKNVNQANYFYTQALTNVAEMSLQFADLSSGITVKGENLSPLSFIKKFAENQPNNINDRSLAASLVVRASKMPESFAAIGKTKPAKTLQKLLSQGKPLTSTQKYLFQRALGSLLSGVKERMVQSVENALAQGKDPKAVATNLQQVYNTLSAKFKATDEGQAQLLQNQLNKLNQTTGLAAAQDPQAYLQAEGTLAEHQAKIKQQLPELSDKQVGQIITYLTNSSDTHQIKPHKLDKYLNVVSQGYSQFKEQIGNLFEAMDKKDSRQLNNCMNKLLGLVNTLNGRPIEGKDEISDIIVLLMHQLAIKESPDFLKSINLKQLEALYIANFNTVDAFPDHVPAEEAEYSSNQLNILSTLGVICEQFGLMIKPLVKHGSSGINGAVPIKENDQATANQLIGDFTRLDALNKPSIQERIDVAASFFPEQAQGNVKILLTKILRAEVIKIKAEADYDQEVGKLIKTYTEKLFKQKYLTELMDKSGFSVESYNAFMNNLLSGEPNTKLKQDFLDQKHHVGPDGIHDTFKVDVARTAVETIGGLNLQENDGRQRLNLFINKLRELGVDDSFKPFITYYLQQAGLTGHIATSVNLKTAPAINDKLPMVTYLMNEGYQPIDLDFWHNIEVKDGIMTIKSTIVMQGHLNPGNVLPKGIEDEGFFPMNTMTITLKIDLSKGVDADGYPKGLSYPVPTQQDLQS